MSVSEPRVVLLRGINVGGHRKVPMAELRDLLGGLGLTDVATYIQSGNAVVCGGPAADEELGQSISAAIAAHFGFEVPVMVRRVAELPAALGRSAELFAVTDPATHDKHVHVAFLSEQPSEDAIAAIDPERSPGDRVVVDGRAAHVAYSVGAGSSKLTLDYLERTLGVSATMRNLATVRKLIDLARSVGS